MITNDESETEMIISQLRAAQIELLLIGALEEETSASDLRSVIEQLESAILTLQLRS